MKTYTVHNGGQMMAFRERVNKATEPKGIKIGFVGSGISGRSLAERIIKDDIDIIVVDSETKVMKGLLERKEVFDHQKLILKEQAKQWVKKRIEEKQQSIPREIQKVVNTEEYRKWRVRVYQKNQPIKEWK